MERCLTSRTGVHNYLQEVDSLHSRIVSYLFLLPKIEHKHEKQAFDKGKLYKVALAIVTKTSPGHKRLGMILKLSEKGVSGELGKHPREVDMGNQVLL